MLSVYGKRPVHNDSPRYLEKGEVFQIVMCFRISRVKMPVGARGSYHEEGTAGSISSVRRARSQRDGMR